jgi:hypothetical protein
MRTIDITPTWGEWGGIYARFAESGEIKAIMGLRHDYARAFSYAQAFTKLLATLTDEQKTLADQIIAAEMTKQGFTA